MLKTKNLAIMFTDMKGFTARTSTHSRQQLHHLLELQDELIKPAIKYYDGEIIKTIGDAFMVAFDSPTDAVLCGMKIQENVLNHNVRAPSSDLIDVRIAINSGEVNVKDGDVFGEPVNIASRIEAIAEPNEVYFTESVYLAMNKNEIPTADVGRRKLKGIPEEIKVYKVVSEQTNLIRAKLKRQQMAQSTADLAKDQEHVSESSEKIQEALEDLQAEGGEELKKQSLLSDKDKPVKKSFWQKHKKKIIITLIILLILIILGIANDKQKLEQELVQEKYPVAELNNKLPDLENEFDKAIKDGNQDRIKAILNNLNENVDKIPSDTGKKISNYLKEQLENPELNKKHKDEIRKILEKL